MQVVDQVMVTRSLLQLHPLSKGNLLQLIWVQTDQERTRLIDLALKTIDFTLRWIGEHLTDNLYLVEELLLLWAIIPRLNPRKVESAQQLLLDCIHHLGEWDSALVLGWTDQVLDNKHLPKLTKLKIVELRTELGVNLLSKDQPMPCVAWVLVALALLNGPMEATQLWGTVIQTEWACPTVQTTPTLAPEQRIMLSN